MSRTTWLLAGQRLLRAGGIRSVKIQPLADEAGLSTGSFYHHFPGMDAYHRALAEFYGSEQVGSMLELVADRDPRARLARLTTLARVESMGPLDAAMRDWAGSDPHAAAAVKETDAALLDFVRAAFEDLGHDRDEARLRAVVLVSLGVARIRPSWRVPRATERVLDLLVRT